MSGLPQWEREGRNWPNRAASRFVESAGLRWHVQVSGTGPAIVLLHGTGAASHSWREVLPLLAPDFTVIVPDLPGHGFTRGRPIGHPAHSGQAPSGPTQTGPTLSGLSLPGMAGAVAQLLDTLNCRPALLAGHSAGVAIALQMVRQQGAATPVVGFNPALMPFPGLAARLFPQLARVLFVNPFVPRMLAGIASLSGETERFLKRATGSAIDAAGVAHYQAIMRCHGHCAGAMEMMARWNLASFAQVLPQVSSPVLLVHSTRDSAVPLSSVRQAAALLPDCHLEVLDRLGHLAHEERPDLAADLIRQWATEYAAQMATRAERGDTA